MAYEAERKLIMAASPLRFDGAFIAGGAVTSAFTNAKINDVDVYFKSRRAFETGVYQAYEDGLWCVAASKRAVTFVSGDTIAQLMHFDYFPTADAIFAAFDYTVCMGALDLDVHQRDGHPDSGFIFHPDFLKHNSQRFLKFNPGTRYPLASATRVLKYQQRGYTIGKGDMMKIALAVRGVRIESWEDLKDQIGGAYGDKIVLGNEDKPFTLDAAIEALTVEDAESEPWVQPANDNMPGNAEDLLRHIANLNGVEFVPTELDEDGWPLADEVLQGRKEAA
ncbi:hypothetical protein DKP76_07270 [Falsochrobactrum shanghaiense]|uniref:Uncharacterized protein n=1 Tax=Falsochrobactrum shanghaiense TaxID=2201899 RepID=A0A316JBM8_9HYPH|nr:hypothetical protein [Falsochrobactrum shanghaiense]PWL18854.1 hypothetical protein DKP76_07270 [Falsochrobactrum shanghaiense]